MGIPHWVADPPTNNYSIRSQVLKATFTPNTPIKIYPCNDPIHYGMNLIGRSTSTAGTRRDNEPDRSNSAEIRGNNDLVAKLSWPEVTQVSEVNVISEAERIREKNTLMKGGAPALRAIVPPRLKCLDEEDVGIAFMDCLACAFFCSLCSIPQHSSSDRSLDNMGGNRTWGHQHREPNVR